jgi:hypothetical protein
MQTQGQPTMTTLYDRLASIAAAKEQLGYLSHFQDDLRVHDPAGVWHRAISDCQRHGLGLGNLLA